MAVEDYADLYEVAGKKHNVDPALLRAIAWKESRGNPKAHNSDTQATGLMQIIPATAKSLGVDPKDPAQAVDGAARLLAESLSRNSESLEDAIGEYHGGPNRKIWGPINREYRASVMAAYKGGVPASSGGGLLDSDLFGGDASAPVAMASTAPGAPADEPHALDPSLFDVEPEKARVASIPTIEISPDNKIIFSDSKTPISEAQTQTIATMQKARMFDASAADGSVNKPYVQRNPQDKFPPGAYYISAEPAGDMKRLVGEGIGADVGPKQKGGQLLRMPGGPDETAGLAGGFGQGLQDVLGSVAELMPGTGDSDIRNALEAGQMIYDANSKGKLVPGIGRFTGQVLGSAPLIAGGEAALAPAARFLGPAGEFLAGNAGGNLAIRGGSLAARGAAEGAGGALLTSSASDEPLSEQVTLGAAGGAVAGPVIPAVTAAGKWTGEMARDLVQPWTKGGREKIADRAIERFTTGENLGKVSGADEIIPGSTPTLAQATGDPGLASLERTLRLSESSEGGQFAARDAQNAAARADFLDNVRGDENSVADLVRTRDNVVREARGRAFEGAQPVDSQSVVAALDEALAAPEAQMESVAGPLQKLRDKIVQPAQETTPEQTRAFNRAVSQTFGADADALTPDVMSAAREKLGAEFERLAGSTNVLADDTLKNGLNEVIHDAGQVIEEAKVKPLQNLVNQVLSTVKSGAIPGASYQALIRKGGPLDVLSKSSDGAMRHYAGQIREKLDDALERTMSSDFPGDRIPRAPEPYVPGSAPGAPAASVAAEPAKPANVDVTDQALEYLRTGKGAGRSERGPSLADAIIKAGGLKDDGELAAMDAKTGYGKRGGLLVRNGKGMTLDEAAQWAQERGYVGKPDLETRAGQGEFLEALRRDLDGKRVYANDAGVTEDIKARADDLEEMLGELGIDPKTMPNGRIRQELDAYFGIKTPAPGGGASAAPTPQATKRGPSLRTAVKVDGKIIQGETHIDAFKKITDLDAKDRGVIGFVDDKGRFLDRAKAMDYARDNGLIDPKFAKYAKTAPELPSEWLPPAAPEPGARSAEDLARGRARLDEYRAVRLQYKNLKTVEKALGSAGVDKQVAPDAVLRAVKGNFKDYAYSGGAGLGDVAESAVREAQSRPQRVVSDAQQIHGMRSSLETQIAKLRKSGTDADNSAADRLQGVVDHIDSTLEGAAPGYGAFRDLSDRSREPIEAQRFLQGLRLKDAKGNVTLAKVDNALEAIRAGRAKKGDHPAKMVSEATVRQLEALKADLLRESNGQLGAPIGSHTAQHLVTGGLAGNMELPLALGATMASGNPLLGMGVGLGKLAYKAKDEQIRQMVASRLLNPEAPPVVSKPPIASTMKNARFLGKPVLPVTGGILANRLIGTQ